MHREDYRYLEPEGLTADVERTCPVEIPNGLPFDADECGALLEPDQDVCEAHAETVNDAELAWYAARFAA